MDSNHLKCLLILLSYLNQNKIDIQYIALVGIIISEIGMRSMVGKKKIMFFYETLYCGKLASGIVK